MLGAPLSALALVAADLCAGARLLCGDQLVRQRLAILREYCLATPEQDGLDREDKLIHEVSSEKGAHHRCAAVDVNVSPWPLTPLRDRSQQVCAADDGRRLPSDISVSERAGNDVLLHAVDPVGERVSGLLGPGTRRDLIRTPALEQGFALLGELVERFPHYLGVEVLHRPTAMAKPTISVLVATAGRLDDAVETYELADQYPHRAPPLGYNVAHPAWRASLRSPGCATLPPDESSPAGCSKT